MSVAYVDTSFLLAIAFGAPGASRLARKLGGFDTTISANLLVAELRAAHLREKIPVDEDILSQISIVLPERPIDREIARVLEHGYVRGADCWHLAAALYLADDPKSIAFLSLDQTQLRFAQALGFRSG